MTSLRRRALLCALLCAPLVARAQARVPVVGYVNGFSPGEWGQPLEGFLRGLRDGGFAEGRDVAIEYRWAEGHYDRVPALVAELVRRPVALIVATGGSVVTVQAHKATKSIPIVFAMGSDPARLGLVSTMNRPGGNVTGVYFLTGDLEAKRFGILRELVPEAALVGILVNPTLPSADARVRALEAASAAIGQRIHIARATNEREIAAAFAGFVERRATALQIGADPYFLTRRRSIVELAARHGIPAIYEQREFAEAGGLMSYGTNLNDASRELGGYAARVLKGERPADMPVIQSTKFEFVINLGTARRMKIAIPQSLSLRADDVIS